MMTPLEKVSRTFSSCKRFPYLCLWSKTTTSSYSFKAAFILYTTGGGWGGGGAGQRIFCGEMGKFLMAGRRDARMPFFLDSIERLGIIL